GTKLMVMVKASAYGSGSAEVAKLLEFQNVDYLGVAYADEGVELRKAGIRLPIMVLNAEEATFDALLRYELEPEIFSFEQLTDFLNFLPESVSQFPVHIKLDTGMHRLGFEETEIEKLSIALRNENRIFVKSIFSHLAASENAAHDSFTATQVSLFEKMYKILSEEIGYQPLRHILNSAGIARFPQFQMDMARLGIGLYGASMPAKIQKKLQTVLTLKATISQIKTLAATETVGYGRMGKLNSAAKIATISIGYADGLLRAAGNGKFSALVRGKRAPVVGNVCMDMTMVDVTKIPDAKAGDEVVIFGKELPVDELASSMGTIPYEIFTNIAERVKRIYYQE
ncbi:MAG TPA: alanine racemase, partial [Saprospiraceae bacterium]|nr:alanine racemase [Saprospiraceae bacterium]